MRTRPQRNLHEAVVSKIDSLLPIDNYVIDRWDASDESTISGGAIANKIAGRGALSFAGANVSSGTRQINGLNVLDISNDFIAAGSYLTLASMTFNSSVIVFSIVCEIDATDIGFIANSVFSISDNDSNTDFQFESGSNAEEWIGQIKSSDITNERSLTGDKIGKKRMFTVVFSEDSDVFFFRTDGKLDSAIGSYSGITTSKDFTLNVFTNRSQGRPIDGAFCELVLYDKPVYISLIETFLSTKWGV